MHKDHQIAPMANLCAAYANVGTGSSPIVFVNYVYTCRYQCATENKYYAYLGNVIKEYKVFPEWITVDQHG